MNDMRLTERNLDTQTNKITARGVQVHYGTLQAIRDVDVDILSNTVTAFIGPSGCGKSTFLRCLNRMNDTIPTCKVTGQILMDATGEPQDLITLAWVMAPAARAGDNP